MADEFVLNEVFSEAQEDELSNRVSILEQQMSNHSHDGRGSATISGTMRSPNYQQATAGWQIQNNGDAEFNSIQANVGTIGGFTITSDTLRDSNDSMGLSSVVTTGDDVRIWAGDTHDNKNTAPFRVYESGSVTASNINITGGSVAGDGIVSVSALNIANRGWTQTCIFSATASNIVSWSSGSFVTADGGTTLAISSGNTGVMGGKTFIYLDVNASLTAYQVTTTNTTAVGASKVLIAIAENSSTEASFQVLSGQGGQKIDADEIVANSITANQLASSIVYAGSIQVATSGNIRSGQTEYNTGTGWFVGDSAGQPKLSIGSPDGNYLLWDGDELRLKGPIDIGANGLLNHATYTEANLPVTPSTEGFNSPTSNYGGNGMGDTISTGSGWPNTYGSQSFAVNHTIDNGSNLLVVMATTHASSSGGGGQIPTSIKFNGTNLTLKTSIINPINAVVSASIWYLVNPQADGSGIEVTNPGYYTSIVAVNFIGADIIDPISSPTTSYGYETSSSIGISTPSSYSYAIDAISRRGESTINIGSGQTLLFKESVYEGGGVYKSHAYSYEVGGGSRTMSHSWSGGNTYFAHAGVAIKILPNFTSPSNAYSSDNTYTTTDAIDGNLYVSISKNGGDNFSNELSKTFNNTESIMTYGSSATELWGGSYLRSEISGDNFVLKIRNGTTVHHYSGFNFTSDTDIVTGIEVAIEGKYDAYGSESPSPSESPSTSPSTSPPYSESPSASSSSSPSISPSESPSESPSDSPSSSPSTGSSSSPSESPSTSPSQSPSASISPSSSVSPSSSPSLAPITGIFYIDHIKVKVYYGTSILPVQDGSMAFATDGYKKGEASGSGTGAIMYYDGSDWHNDNVAWKCGKTAKNTADASTTQNIAHGLGRTPKIARLTFVSDNSGLAGGINYGYVLFDGTTANVVGRAYAGGTERNMAGTDIILYGPTSGSDAEYQTGVFSMDSTNISIVWTKTSNPVGTYDILWEVEG
jgi:hypothetical protein